MPKFASHASRFSSSTSDPRRSNAVAAEAPPQAGLRSKRASAVPTVRGSKEERIDARLAVEVDGREVGRAGSVEAAFRIVEELKQDPASAVDAARRRRRFDDHV